MQGQVTEVTRQSDGAGFCASCGKSVTSGAGGTGAAKDPAPAAAPAMTSNVAAALTYLVGFITGIVLLVLEQYKNDRFVRFHAMQSIFYSGASIILMIAWGILWSALFAITGSLTLLVVPVWILLRLAMFPLALIDVPGVQQSRVSHSFYR